MPTSAQKAGDRVCRYSASSRSVWHPHQTYSCQYLSIIVCRISSGSAQSCSMCVAKACIIGTRGWATGQPPFVSGSTKGAEASPGVERHTGSSHDDYRNRHAGDSESDRTTVRVCHQRTLSLSGMRVKLEKTVATAFDIRRRQELSTEGVLYQGTPLVHLPAGESFPYLGLRASILGRTPPPQIPPSFPYLGVDDGGQDPHHTLRRRRPTSSRPPRSW